MSSPVYSAHSLYRLLEGAYSARDDVTDAEVRAIMRFLRWVRERELGR